MDCMYEFFAIFKKEILGEFKFAKVLCWIRIILGESSFTTEYSFFIPTISKKIFCEAP